MRMIDADMLADGLKLHRQSTDQKHETDRQWAVGYNAGLERALYSISYAPTLTPPNEWISVEDRLPGVTGKYIACVKDNMGARWTICADWSVEMKSWFGEFGEIKNKVTHWMPLPEPPESRPTEGEEDT